MVRLIDAPVGLFRHNNTLVMKTEYSTPHPSEDGTDYTPDCYIVSSGEYFWGGVHSAEERNEILVEPIPLHRVYIMGPNLSKAKGGDNGED